MPGADCRGSSMLAVAMVKAQPNGSRLSCGAVKKDSSHNLRAPSASTAHSFRGLHEREVQITSSLRRISQWPPSCFSELFKEHDIELIALRAPGRCSGSWTCCRVDHSN